MRISDWSSDVCASDLLVGAEDGDEIVEFGDALGVGRPAFGVNLQGELNVGLVLADLAHRVDMLDRRLKQEVRPTPPRAFPEPRELARQDRKSTRLNSSH